MDSFPAFYPLKGRRVVVAGDGEGAEAKARLFRDSPAVLVRLDRDAALDPDAYAGAGLVFVASYDAEFCRQAAAAARACGAPLNVVDHPELSDFITPAIVDRGQVVAAIGSGGAAPLLASLLRAEIEARVRPGAGLISALLGERREALRAAFPDLPLRRAFLRAVLAGPAGEAAEKGDAESAAAELDRAIAGGWSAVGRVTYISVPRSDDLVPLRAVRALNVADIVLYGAAGAALVNAHARRDAEHWPAAEATEEAIAAQALAGRLVAVVGAEGPADLPERLAARGVAIETLRPAPPP